MLSINTFYKDNPLFWVGTMDRLTLSLDFHTEAFSIKIWGDMNMVGFYAGNNSYITHL